MNKPLQLSWNSTQLEKNPTLLLNATILTWSEIHFCLGVDRFADACYDDGRLCTFVYVCVVRIIY